MFSYTYKVVFFIGLVLTAEVGLNFEQYISGCKENQFELV